MYHGICLPSCIRESNLTNRVSWHTGSLPHTTPPQQKLVGYNYAVLRFLRQSLLCPKLTKKAHPRDGKPALCSCRDLFHAHCTGGVCVLSTVIKVCPKYLWNPPMSLQSSFSAHVCTFRSLSLEHMEIRSVQLIWVYGFYWSCQRFWA